MTVTCSRCGAMAEAPEGGLPPRWSIAVEDGRTSYECDRCVRDNIRSIEAKLPQDWWE